MWVHNYKDYEEYKRIQSDANKAKINNVWAKPEVLDYVGKSQKDRCFGICHGSRNGYEVYYLNTLIFGGMIIGTDISDTAEKYNLISQLDFHNVRKEWVGNVDFIYSNSFDHAYDPEKALDAWMSCITRDGTCYIEWYNLGSECDHKRDCFGCTVDEFKAFVGKKYDYTIKEFDVIPYTYLFMITHKGSDDN